MHEVIRLGLIDRDFIENRTSNYDRWPRPCRTTRRSWPRRSPVSTSSVIREVARLWGEARAGVIYWGMGISQHTTGTDNCRCLIAMCAITGNVGRPGTGLHPLRGQNNVQGASDAGLIPMFYPDYQSVEDSKVRARVRAGVGHRAQSRHRADRHRDDQSILDDGVRGMYMLGENPFLSDPNINKVRKALSKLDFLVVQDIFLTETAEFADVVLPASSYLEKSGTYTNTDRRVQLGRKVFDPPGDARVDWEIVQDIARRLGLDWNYVLAERDLRRDGAVDAGLRQPHPRQPRARRASSTRQRPGPQRRHRGAVRRAVQHRRRARAPGAGGVVAGARSCPARSSRSCSIPDDCCSTGTPGR